MKTKYFILTRLINLHINIPQNAKRMTSHDAGTGGKTLYFNTIINKSVIS